MIYFLLLICLGYCSSLAAQQHDLDPQTEETAYLMFQKGLEYYNQTWQTYKKNNASSTARLGNCIEFSLSIITALKTAEQAYEEFEKTRPNRINQAYTSKRLELETQKNILHFALLVDSQMRAALLNDVCLPSKTVQSPNR